MRGCHCATHSCDTVPSMSGSRPSHLARRGAFYLVRFRIPAKLVDALGLAELRRSLHTADPRRARERALRATVWFRDTMEKFQGMAALSRADLERAAALFFSEMAGDLDRPRDFDAEHFDDELQFNIDTSRERIRSLDAQLKQNVFDGLVRRKADELIALADADSEELAGRLGLYALQLAARAEREQLEFLVHLLTSPSTRFKFRDELFESRPASSQAAVRMTQTSITGSGSDVPTVGEAVRLYLRWKGARQLSQSQIDEITRALNWLQERFGSDTDLDAITKRQLITFRDDLARVDVSLRGLARPFDARLTNNRSSQIKSVTALRYWRSVQTFFGWCAAELDLDPNPAAGLVLPARKGEVVRSPEAFSQAELLRLFKTPLYAGYKSAKRPSEPGNCHVRGGKWWSAILLMHTGLRAGELAQLLPADFVFAADIPHLKVRPEDDAGKQVKSTKNLAAVREVPLAPALLQLGLAEFVERQSKIAPKGRVFRDFRLGTGGRTSDGLTKFWRAYLKKYGLWKAGRATHVWRHSLIACLRANDVPAEDIAAFVGHSQGTVTEGYGGSYPLSRKVKTAQRLNYGFDVVAALGGPYERANHGGHW